MNNAQKRAILATVPNMNLSDQDKRKLVAELRTSDVFTGQVVLQLVAADKEDWMDQAATVCDQGDGFIQITNGPRLDFVYLNLFVDEEDVMFGYDLADQQREQASREQANRASALGVRLHCPKCTIPADQDGYCTEPGCPNEGKTV